MWLNLQVYLLFTYSVIFHQLVRRVLMLHVGHVTRFLHLTCLCRSRIIQSWSESSVCCCCCDPQKVPHLYDELRLRPVQICSRVPSDEQNLLWTGRVLFWAPRVFCRCFMSLLLSQISRVPRQVQCLHLGGRPGRDPGGFPSQWSGRRWVPAHAFTAESKSANKTSCVWYWILTDQGTICWTFCVQHVEVLFNEFCLINRDSLVINTQNQECFWVWGQISLEDVCSTQFHSVSILCIETFKCVTQKLFNLPS